MLAGVLVGLIDDGEAGVALEIGFVPRDGEGGGDFVGVVGVVGIDAVREALKAAAGAGEAVEGGDDLFGGEVWSHYLDGGAGEGSILAADGAGEEEVLWVDEDVGSRGGGGSAVIGTKTGASGGCYVGI